MKTPHEKKLIDPFYFQHVFISVRADYELNDEQAFTKTCKVLVSQGAPEDELPYKSFEEYKANPPSRPITDPRSGEYVNPKAPKPEPDPMVVNRRVFYEQVIQLQSINGLTEEAAFASMSRSKRNIFENLEEYQAYRSNPPKSEAI